MSEFICPIECLHGVGEVWSGDYDFPGLESKGNPIILDIGANCGAYSLRALDRWPEATVIAYEPNPAVFSYLEKNCSPKVTCVNSAVGDRSLNRLNLGRFSTLCSSQYENSETSDNSISISVVHPSQLPVADIVKIDAEGAEAFIVEQLTFIPMLLALEWHSDEQRVRIEAALKGKMRLVSSKVLSHGRGILQLLKT